MKSPEDIAEEVYANLEAVFAGDMVVEDIVKRDTVLIAEALLDERERYRETHSSLKQANRELAALRSGMARVLALAEDQLQMHRQNEDGLGVMGRITSIIHEASPRASLERS